VTDKIMRRLWVSPWVPLFSAIFCSIGASSQHGYGLWFWVGWGAAIYGYVVFLSRGSKRWGPK
jgi:hypothetical protein